MGAATFETWAWGTTPQEAFNAAVEEARWESGHGGYTGTIAEKDSFVEIRVPDRWKQNIDGYIRHLINTDDHRISDKWGPAGCILLESKPLMEQVPYATTTEKYQQQGTRKWETRYVVASLSGGASRDFKSQTEAEKFAKDWVKRTNSPAKIRIEKRLVNGSQDIMTIRPKTKQVKSKKTLNKYVFFGWASS